MISTYFRNGIAFFAFFFLLAIPKGYAAMEDRKIDLHADQTHTETLDDPTAIAFTFDRPIQNAEYSIYTNNEWGHWENMHFDDAIPTEYHSLLIGAKHAQAVRIRSNANTYVTLHIFKIDDSPITWQEASAGRLIQSSEPILVRRQQWGADETLRELTSQSISEDLRAFYSNAELSRKCSTRGYLYPEEFREKRRILTEDLDGDGNKERLAWPIGYSEDVKLIVIHHTAETYPNGDVLSDAERMRAIYEYHARGRNWGDIGYNYVVGKSGTIFEGRAGGIGAVGAHAYCNNVGSVGIALMGNFENDIPNIQQLNSLSWLIGYLSRTHHINPLDETLYHGRLMPTVVGHRDIAQTACPGKNSQILIPQIRHQSLNSGSDFLIFSPGATASTNHEAAQSASLEPIILSAGKKKSITVQFMNVGLDTWNQNTWLMAETTKGIYFPHVPPSSYVAGVINETVVRPGEIASFTFDIQAGLEETSGKVQLVPVINNARRLVNNAATLSFRTTSSASRFSHVSNTFPSLHRSGEDVIGTVKLLNTGEVPWEYKTMTQIGFKLTGGSGYAYLRRHPSIIPPGSIGSFEIVIQDIEDIGLYERNLQPIFHDGTLLEGNPVKIRSRAEPIPEIEINRSHNSAPSYSADRVIRASRLSSNNNVRFEPIDGTVLTLTPRGQGEISIRLHAGSDGISRFQRIAPITRSHSTITVYGQNNDRMTEFFTAPLSLRANQSREITLRIIAPRQEGTHTVQIGDMTITLDVREQGRTRAELNAQTRIAERLSRRKSVQENRMQRIAQRRARRQLEQPKIVATASPSISPISSSTDESQTPIRIRIFYTNPAATISSPGTVQILGNGKLIRESGPITLSYDQWKCKARMGNGTIIADAVRITPEDPNGYTTVMSSEKTSNQFRGTLECRIIDGQIALINELGIEDYLSGLAEEPDTEPWEKQRAFAIAARSYALYYTVTGNTKYPNKPYNGTDDPASFQAYGGKYFEGKNPRWTKAVRDTAGQVLTWQRQIVKPPYFSSDSGQTNSAEDVWGWTHTPYLDSKPDPWCEGMTPSGHGVGMSGCGAEGQANEGKTAEEILEYYYPGTKILPVEKTTDVK